MLLTVLVISGFVVYGAYIDRTVYTTEQLVIIPGKVTSDSWLGLESVLVQDISEYSLYQDFTQKNSAYISELGLFSAQESEDAPTPDNPNEVSIEGDETASSTDSDVGQESAPSESDNPTESNEESQASDVDSVTEPEVEPTPEPEPEPTTEPETVSSTNTQSSLVWGVFPKTDTRFALAQAIINESIDTPVTEPEPEPVPEPETTESPASDEPAPETSAEQSSESETAPAAEGEGGSEGGEVPLEGEVNNEGETASEVLDDEQVSEEPEVIVDTSNDYVMVPCVAEAGCATHSMLFSDFLMPDFESGTVLDAIQLRLSLAAQTKNNRGDGPQRFLVEYTYDTSTSAPAWITASVLDIDDEISNSINGGYYLLSLLPPRTAGEIANLQIKISYQGNVSELETAYVEGMWLEVTSGKFFEEGSTDPFTDELTYGRDLLAPELNTLDNADLDPTLSTLPSFTLSYDPQQGFFNRIFRSLFSENTFVVEKINLTDSNGEYIDVPFAIDYHDNETWTMRAQKMPQKLRPGKYLVTVEILENDERFTDTFEFYWGVLAVNTKKSMYFPREEVVLNLAALTDKGDTICNANLELKIIDPKNNIYEVPVEQSGACGPNNVTDIPDYLASFTETGEWGVYTIQLQHKNASGEIVHKITDSFEVRDYIPFDIERTAPTRIYPPAPYDVTLKIKAYRDFVGDINERVPRGFIIEGLEGALITTLPEYTLITWKDVTMVEGEERTLSYNFDAPDISPYMYLLGPLDMDGFSELRQWQIASDALNNIGWFTGTRTVAGTNLNNAASPFQWSTSSIDNFYYSHSTSTESHKVTLRQTGEYLISVNLPQQRSDANVSRTRGAIEIRKNGFAVPEGLGRSGYITGGGAGTHTESSSNVSFLMTDVQANDYIEVYVENLSTIDPTDTILVSGRASMYIEYIRSTETVFAATTTKTTNSTNLNQITPYALEWTETRQDTGFSHSNTINPENITLTASGTYMVHINVPTTGFGHTVQQNINGRVLLNGSIVSGGHFQQGYMETAATESDGDSSIHWSGIVVATTTGQVLTVTTAREAGAGTTSVPTGFVGSIYIQKLPTDDVIALRGADLVTGSNFNILGGTPLRFNTQLAYDNTTFSHSTTTNSHQITVNESGDYILNFNDSLTSGNTTVNSKITVTVGGATTTGAETKSNFLRNQNGHNQSSSNLVFLLEDVTAGQIISVHTEREASFGTISTTTDSMIMLWKKAAFNFRPPAPTTYALPFDNIQFASTTPYFDFQSNDPDGASDIEYEFSISTSSDFATATIRVSGTDAGFINTASSSDTSPFVESNIIRFQLQPADALIDTNTYYWRVRARDVSGSGEFGDYSTTQSLTVNFSDAVPSWYQTLSGQFQTNTLLGTVSAGSNNNVTVDATVSSEILIGYGDGTNTTPRYRLWNGSVWGSELNALSVGGTINWVKTAAGNTRDEYIMVTMDQSNSTYAQVYDGTATSSPWGDQTLLTSTVASNTTNGIAVGYESLSGDAMAVSCTNGPNPVYRIWNGSSWSATTSITVSLAGVCNYLEIASDPASDELILVVRDSVMQYQALVWNGSSWTSNQVLGSGQVGQTGRAAIALKYESSGDQAIIAVTNGQNNSIIYTTWNGTSFTTNTTQAIGNDFEFAAIASDPNSDNLALCYIDEDADIGVLRWNGGVWSAFFELETAGNSQAARPFDCEFETVAGRAGNIIAMYSDTVGARYRVFNYASTSWTAEATITGVGNANGLFWGQSERAGNGTIVSVWHDDNIAGDEIESSFWNGTNWSAKQAIVPNPSSVIGTPFETFSMAAKRFQFTQGIVRSTPISFTSVPGQPTWGDVSFSTTEPFGTDVLVRVRYTSTTTCDTYVPDGVLAGNSAGFGVESVPVVLTGLSTSTYNQLCLEATLTTLGAASASLNDWTLSWQRKPKLIQSAYRWYDNGSFFTPTDPWPAGVTDVAENTPLTSTESVNINDIVRLRLALQGANVLQATNTASFKLQYASGPSCNLATNWNDVGETGSTTALWRGATNAIIGSDWLNASWLRRIKITVEGTLVNGPQTDFPVYVNLDDLPDSFFTQVQSDGDDIRVTNADGITEVPFELVSIDTVARRGELHFKATLASTTDTEFFIYYRNPSASGYAVSATYGRNNVWTNGYEAVYHLGTSPASSMTDSTSNGRTLTMSGGMTAANSTSSVLGNGIDFDGINDRFTNAGWSWTAAPVTVTAWSNVSTAETKTANLFGFTAVGNERLATHAPWSDAVLYWDYGTCCAAPGRLTTNYAAFRNKWTHVGLVSQGTPGAFMGIYLDGALAASSVTSDDPNVTLTGFSLGSDNPSGGNHQDGRIDEFRIASVARSGGWIATERTNQSNPTGFYAVASEELIGDGSALPSTLLTGSDKAETYEESNPTESNRFAIPVDDASEWDFVLQNNAALPNTNYCFRAVYVDGSTLNTYSQYPQLITNAPPPPPILTAPFDNEQFASTSPWFEFSADDEVSDEVSYEIMVDTDYNFGSPDVTNESNANFSLFTNLASPSERGLYTTGQTIRYIPSATLTAGNTYWWRVRAKDDNGSGTYSEWSVPSSFTIASGTAITTWFQTTGEQFSTNSLNDAISSTSTNDVGIDVSFTNATMTTTVIDFDDRDVGNAWGALSFVQNTTSGTIRHYVEYRVSGESFALVPDSLIPGNSGGLTTSPVSLTALDTALYNELRIVSILSGTPSLPRIQSLTVTWGQTIDVPTLVTPFDNAKVATTTPSFTFKTSDPQNDSLEYEFQFSSNYAFTSSSTFNSGVDAGFVNTASSSDLTPFNSNEVVRYTMQSPLTNGNTYWWRVRARDPLGSNSWSNYSAPESFTVDTSILVSVWHQTTGEQFATNALQDIETTAGGAQITSLVSGVMSAYGEGTGQAPQYRIWNGTSWSAAASADTVGAQIRWTQLKAAPTRPEYALATLGTDLDINIQIYDGVSESWDDMYEIYTEATDSLKRRFDIEYETNSGDLLAVACEGTEARYSIWNGTSWSASSSINLANANNCEWVKMAADPVSDEIIVVFRHTNSATPDYEALVWNGSSWGSSLVFGDMQENAHEGIALNYEASGNQAVAIVSNNTLGSFLWSAWNGSVWTTATATAIANDFEWGSLKRDVGTDNMVLCYIDDGNDVGVKRWNGSAWSAGTVMTIAGNTKLGQPVDCEYQTLQGTDGDIIIPYSDTIDAKYQRYETATGTFSGEFTLIAGTNINDSWRFQTVRGGDGTIHLFAFDDGSAPDRYDTSRWDGTAWSARENFSTTPSILAQPYDGSITAAAQIYPNFTSGQIVSTPIDFADGSGPRWERITWTDSTPAASDIRYRLYYQTATSSFALVPDSALAGNAAGFTVSPVSIAGIDRTIYSVLKLEAELICDSGTCPTIQDWSVEWSQGINVSGTAYEYDGTTTVATGTVAVAVNGILQSGKTAVIGGGGTWTIPNVTAFSGDAITVFIDGASDSDEAVGITTYDGVGDVIQMELSKRTITFGSADIATTTNSMFGAFDTSDDEDVFFSVTGSSSLAACGAGACSDVKIKIKQNAIYQPGGNVTTFDLENLGSFRPETNTIRVGGSWLSTGTFVPSLSTVIFTATTSARTITSSSTASTTIFHNVTFGETAGAASWTVSRPLDITGTLAVDFGTLVRATSTINLEQNLRIGSGGFISGIGTTTFDGSGSHTWTDTSASSTNVGNVVIDGTAKTVTLGGNVTAQSVTIGADDTLNASGSGFNINVVTNWTNNNSFIPQSGTVMFIGTSSGVIARGTSAFNNLTFSGVGGNWSFSTSTLAINNNITIATGTVTLPTGTTTIGGNFTNSGGTFLHNNGEVRMTSATAGRTITQLAGTFLNAFYDLTFAGAGAWSYTEAAATTTRNYNIQSGTVTMPSGTLTVGGNFAVTGSGAFLHNNGEVVLLVQGSDAVRTNGSNFNNVRLRGSAATSWYNNSWSARQPIVINSSQVPTNLTDFPIYVNLANLPASFFSAVNASGTDIRVTTSDGVTEVPHEVVAISTSTLSGELHFRASSVSSSTNTTFYIYYGNSGASAYAATSTFGRNNVWSNGYEAVYHLGTNPAATMIDSTRNGRNLTSVGGMGGGNSVAGVLGNGVDFDGVNDYLTNAGFAWPNASNTVTVTAWNNVTTAETKAGNLFGFTESGGQRFATHGPWSDAILYWDFGPAVVPGRVSTSYAAYRNKWTHVALTSPGAGGGNMSIYFDGTFITNSTASDPNVTLTGFSVGSLGASQYHDGRIDEFRIASVVRTAGWIATEENNQSSTTAFYTVSAPQNRTVRTFTDTNATILGNYIAELGGDAVFPTGVLSIGGSFDNDATFSNSSGTVRFNSTAGAETIAMGTTSSFATLEFNSATGNFTVVENATATVAINLTNASAFTVQSGLTLAALGTFTNAATASSTTWTGSTLSLSGPDGAINAKSHGGDAYGTILTNGDTDMTMWNSTATTYTTASTSSIYSADHGAVDGDLNIYGDYVRTTGTEFWSFATDFDGAALTGTTSRQVDVRIATSSRIGFVSASLNMVGSPTGSTTVDAQSGAYDLNATNTTITASNFTIASTSPRGLALNGSTTLASFQDGFFTVVPGRSGITISSTTVSTNPAAQYQRIGFATTTAGAGTNVTLTGTSSSFVWFRSGTGNLYGEAYDAGDGNPGSVRWDDSTNSITISGIVYADDGVTPLGAPTCNGTTPNVRVVVNDGSFTASTTCAAGTGAYTLTGVSYLGDPKITVYLNTNGGVAGTVVTKTPTANITNMHIFANRVITRHQDVAPLTIADMTTFDFNSDSDIKFIATTTGSTTLSVLAPNSLFVFATTTFAPGGNVTLFGNASSSAVEGTLQLGNAASFTATGTETHTLAGRLVLATTSTLTSASSTFIFNATTTGKSITSPNTVTFNALQFTGIGGGWNITAPLIVNANMDVATGTVTGTSNVTVTNGSLSGDGTLSFGSGTTTINRANTFGGARAWTFANLALGNGSVVGTTTRNGTATTTISGRLTINPAHFLVTGSSSWDLSGTGSVFVESGTFLEDTSKFRYSGAGSQVLSTTYYDLDINAGAGTPTYTATGVGIGVTNNLTIGGTATSTFDVNANDPALIVGGSVSIRNNGVFSASNVATTTISGSYTNLGTFTSNNGTVAMVGAGSNSIAPGNSSFGTLLINNAAGTFTVSQNATTTVALNLLTHTSFVQASGTTMAIGGMFTNSLGGGATTFSSSTLYFYGANTKNINAKTTSDAYHTLTVASSTNVRMWNSSAVNYNALGGIYSQDHASVDGNLNIYGNYSQTTGNDYWSANTDFDGAVLGGLARKVDVRMASGSSAMYSGGGLEVIGTSTASTSVTNQGVGRYGLTISGTASTTWDTVQVRNTNTSGVVFTGTPNVNNFSRTDHEIDINTGTGITVGGMVIDANQAKNFTNNIFATSSGIASATNVTATGTTISSWRFTNHTGALSGEPYDSDPTGDPGYIVWDDSAALITVSGNVYSDEGVTVSPVCNGVTQNILLRVAGLTTYTASCDAGTGAYSISGVAYSPADTLTVYIDNNIRKAVTVSSDPISSISNMHLYENRVIVRHENTSPLSVAKMAVWDSSDDGDIMFTAVDAGIDTLTLPADQKLLIWNGKTFEPAGNVTVSGGGGGGAQDGTLEAQGNATFRALGAETHSIGGSMIFGTGATFTSGQSTTTFTTTGAGRTIDVNSNPFFNVAFTGSGSYTVTDATFSANRSVTQSNGAITFGSGTTTIGASFNATGGSFTMGGAALVFTSTTTGNIVRFDDSVVPSVRFQGTGGVWSMTDTNATTTGSFTIASGTVTLPSGNLAVAGSFDATGTVIHNTADIIMSAASSAIVRASSSNLFAVRFTGVGPFTLADVNLTLVDSLTLATGTLTLATGTVSVGGDFLIASGTVNNATGTVLFNATSVGKTVNFGNNPLYNVVFGSGTGGWNFLGNATTTNNFSITGANTFTKAVNTNLNVGGVFTNTVGGANTTWATTTLRLYGPSNYTINTKTTGGDVYGTLEIASPLAIRAWNSSAATTTVLGTASLYSQDHAAIDGALNIYGNFGIATTTEYWSYSTDFDGAVLAGASQRQVNVRLATNATTTLSTGALQIIGTAATSTTIAALTGGTFAFEVNGGTFNAQYYSIANLNALGLNFSGTPTITNLANGYYNLTTSGGSLITLTSAVLDANASKIFAGVGFATTSAITGNNVTLTGSTSNAWRFSGSYGNLGGEAYDVDGLTACGSIRFDNSGCLLTQQTHYRWRNDDGGEGAPNSEWFNSSFDYRQRVRVVNTDASNYASTAVKLAVAYDSNMQSSFDDLRFTSADGLTTIPHWIERYTASTDATVWVRIPNLLANETATVFMYYGSSTAPTTSNGPATFDAFDDFEDNNITEYSGDTGLFQTDTTPVYGGTYALEAFNKGGRTTDGIFRTAMTVSQGQIIRFMQYLDAAGSGDDACTLFGVQSPGTSNNNYAICLQKFGVDRVVIARNISDNDSSGVVLASSTATFATGWYEVEVDWRTNNSINAIVRTAAGALVATASTTDATYTTGGIGFTFWFQNGSWDSYTARPRAILNPTVYFGAEQTDGGATWERPQNVAGSGVTGVTKRLRFAIENSGLDITNQTFRLEYAAKGAAPSCEAVSSGSYIALPNQASCGSSPLCMQTSTNVADNDPSTDHLASTTGAFSAGRVVESPSNITSSLNVNQNRYTELEYVLTPTINATSSYCLRLTNGGTPLDFYNKVAELSLQFDPVFGPVTLNNGNPISLTPGTTTSIFATSTVTDFNGYADIVAGSSTIYRSGAGPACVADTNNCYKGDTTASSSCSFINCAGNTCTLSCRADIFFNAEASDMFPYEGEEWLAYLEVRDTGGGYDFASALGVELLTIRAAAVNNAINYGSLAVADNTGAFNPTTTISNVGNAAFNLELLGTDLSDGGSSLIPADQQKYATSTFTYSACISCGIISSTTPTMLALGLAKPTVPNPPVTAEVYWGIAVPVGVNSAPHSGINVFTPVSP